MLTSVLQKEFRSLLADARLRWSAIVSLGLFLLVLITGVSHYQNTNGLYTKAQEDTYRQWLDQGEKNPHSAAHYGIYAYKPVPLLAIYDRGMDDYLGNAVWLEAHNQNEVKLRPVQDAGTIGRFGSLTVGFIWQFILPLIIILLSYNSLSKEYESGTLRMLLSTQVSTFSLLSGKVLGILTAVLFCLYLPMLLLLSGALYWAGGAEAFAQVLPSLGLASVLYTLFYAVFVVLSVSFSAWLRSSGLSLAALLGVWAIGAFLLPRISGSVAMSLHPTPSALDFTEKVLSQREKGLDGQDSYEKFQEALKAKALRDYDVDSLSQLPVSFAGIALQASEDRDWKVYDLQYGALFRLFQAQNALLERFNLLSPILAMRDVSRSLAGTDLYKHLNFTRQAENHRRLVAKVMNTDQKINGVVQERDYKAGVALWQKVPQFQYQNQSLGEQLQQQWFSLFSLGCWLLGLTFCLYRNAQTLPLD